MKKSLSVILFVSSIMYGQVGINSVTPKATLEIIGNPNNKITDVDGILIPRVDRLKAQSMLNIPVSTLVYINDISTGSQVGQAQNIDKEGFYFFDGTLWTKIISEEPKNIYNSDSSLTTTRKVDLANNNLSFIGEGNIGINTQNPEAKLEISSGIDHVSGLKFTNFNSNTPSTPNLAPVGIDNNGNIAIIENSPIKTNYKTFKIDSNTPTNSVISMGGLQFRYNATSCNSGNSFLEIRAINEDQPVLVHGIQRTNKSFTSFIISQSFTITPIFSSLNNIPIDCSQAGHVQFSIFSFLDSSYYRVNIHVSDGDPSSNTEAKGYILVEHHS